MKESLTIKKDLDEIAKRNPDEGFFVACLVKRHGKNFRSRQVIFASVKNMERINFVRSSAEIFSPDSDL